MLKKVINWIIALLGLWEAGDIAAPFVPGFGSVPDFLWNHIIVGIILMVAGVGAALTRNSRAARVMNWLAAAAGAWLVLASFILGNPAVSLGLWNDIIVGAIVSMLGAWAAIKMRRVSG